MGVPEFDLGALFGQQQQPNPEAFAAGKALHDAQHREELRAYGQVQFFGAVLCSCDPWFDRYDRHPPQMGCVVHGHLQFSHDGELLMFGIPRPW